MLKRIGCTLLCAGAFFSSAVFAVPQQQLMAGLTMEFVFIPNDPQEFTNFYWSRIDATCVISTPDASNPMFAEGKDRKGRVNDIPISKGESMTVVVRNGDKLRLSAEAGAVVRITNMGASTLKATCST